MMEEGYRIQGFRVRKSVENKEINGRGLYLVHEKTGAPLFWLDNGAENKTFGISFRTIPSDDTGVFHILEHSLLCGSERFPVREPFVELLKSSMSTFLNAMTFPDMTMYPVSSRNDRDLLNLTEVYLDAVFAPLCIRDEKVFLQEGWHIETGEEGQPSYKGVVFNEMKGAMSDVDSLIEHQIVKQLFPDNGYGYNSGGDPECIPDLTFEQFAEQYARHYHPTNAMIYLDGAVPIEEILKLLDRYLSRYERCDSLPQFTEQKPLSSEKTIYYEIGPDEPEQNRSYLTLGRLTGFWHERTVNTARGIICDVLTGSNEAPLKRAVLERELCQDFSVSVDDTGYQSWISIQAENVRDGCETAILELIREQGEKIRDGGLDPDAVEASMNRAIFHFREEDEPQGIGRCIRAMGTWLYGGDPMDALCFEEMIPELKKMLREGEFSRLAADMLLNTENRAVLHTVPSRTVGAEKRRKEAERLAGILSAWSEDERRANTGKTEKLLAWQMSPDSPEMLKKLPMLKKEDAYTPPRWIDTEQTETEGVRVWTHCLPCNGVVHIRLYFRLTDCTLNELTRLSGLAGLLGRMPTEAHDAFSLQQDIRRYTGSLGFAIVTQSQVEQDETCTPFLVGYTSALKENAGKAQELLLEILTSSKFDDEKRILEMIQQVEMGIRQRIASAGHAIGVKKVLSHFSAENAVRNALEGDEFIRYIHGFAANPGQYMQEFRATLTDALRRSVCRKRMLVSVTADERVDVTPMICGFREGTAVPEKAAYASDSPYAIGYRIPAQTGYAVRGYRLSRCHRTFSGIMWLAAEILSLGYLWNRIRVQGGAYGAGFSVDRSGNLFLYSYRDPTPVKTLSVCGGFAAYLKEISACGEELDKYIISSLNELNPLLSSKDLGIQADARLFAGITREDSEKIRQEILRATPEDLAACDGWLDEFARESAVCVVAYDDALKEAEGLQLMEL